MATLTNSLCSNNTAVSLLTGTGALNLGTQAAVNVVTVGNSNGASSVVINGGTGGAGAISIGTIAHDVPVTIGNATAGSSVTINSGTGGVGINSTGVGDIILTSSDTCLVDSAGVLELNSSAGVISIGNDAVAQNINIGTGAAARSIAIGNTTGATAITIDTGSGELQFHL